MKVTAIKQAFIGGSLVHVGQEVDVPAGYKGSWCVPSGSDDAKAVKPAKPAKETPKALSELTGEKAKSFTDVHGQTLA